MVWAVAERYEEVEFMGYRDGFALGVEYARRWNEGERDLAAVFPRVDTLGPHPAVSGWADGVEFGWAHEGMLWPR